MRSLSSLQTRNAQFEACVTRHQHSGGGTVPSHQEDGTERESVHPEKVNQVIKEIDETHEIPQIQHSDKIVDVPEVTETTSSHHSNRTETVTAPTISFNDEPVEHKRLSFIV